MTTRLQEKSREAKKVMGHGTAAGVTAGKKPRADLKGYPRTAGIPIPVLIGDGTPAIPLYHGNNGYHVGDQVDYHGVIYEATREFPAHHTTRPNTLDGWKQVT